MGCSVTYKFWSRDEIKSHLLRQCMEYNLPPFILKLSYEAAESDLWTPQNQFDGCTVVQDKHHPYLPCFIHDFMWVTGMGGKEADRLFYKLLLNTGMSKFKAKTWYLGVRIAWLCGYRYIHLKKRNVRAFTENTRLALNSYGIPHPS